MLFASELSEGIGPRLTFTNRYQKAVEWAMTTLQSIGLKNVKTEYWEPLGRDWELKKYTFTITEPYPMFINSCPKAWCNGTNGPQTADLVFLNARTPEDFESFKGKLKGKIVLISPVWPHDMNFDPIADRWADSTLSRFAAMKARTPEEIAQADKEEEEMNARYKPYFQLLTDRIDFCTKEGAVAIIESGFRSYGSVMSFSVTLPGVINDQFDFLVKGYKHDAPDVVPQISISSEQYCTLVHLLKKGTNVKGELNIEAKTGDDPVKGMNVIGEITGSKYPNEIVTIGAHLDSYQAGLGAADNGAGVAVMIEAMRLLIQCGLIPERTIRIGLWGGEEQGYFGSTSYVETHFKSGKEKHFLYLNLDNGSGLIRGIQLHDNVAAVSLMQEWFNKANLEGSKTVSLMSADLTDHIPFLDAGLPGYQFIQDHLDYFSIYHTQVDVMERLIEDDLKKNAFLVAFLAWMAANHEGTFPE